VYANAIGKHPAGAYTDGSNGMLFIEGANYLPYAFGLKNGNKRLNF
jgi:hypothetical protein